MGFVLYVVSAPHVAAAYEPARLTIELLAARDEVPSHVCVLHQLGNRIESAQVTLTENTLLETLFDSPNAESAAQAITDAGNALGISRSEANRPQGAVARELCGNESCRPLIRLSAHTGSEQSVQRMTCAVNAVGRQQVLMLSLRLPGDREGEVDSVSIDGSLIAINGSWGKTRPTVEVIGGHYLPGDATSASEDNRAQLHIQTRCVRRDLKLPPLVRRAPHLTGRSPDRPLIEVDPTGAGFVAPEGSSCSRPLCDETQRPGCVAETVSVLLSRGNQNRVTALLSLPQFQTSSATQSFKLRMEARWNGDTIPNPLPLNAFDVRFMLRTRCEFALAASQHKYGCDSSENDPYDGPAAYTEGVCPDADVVDAGIVCRSKALTADAKTCVYECAAPDGAAAFRLPVTLRFSLASRESVLQEDAWREQLSQIDQQLTGFTPEAHRQFRLLPSREANDSGARDAGDRLNTLRIWTPAGLKYEFTVTSDRESKHNAEEWPVLPVPGGRCGAPLTYQYTGSRFFHEGITKICNGQIFVPAPRKTATRWTWGMFVAPAFALELNTENLELAGSNPAYLGKLATRYQPTVGEFGHGWSLEEALSVLYMSWPYYPLDVPDSAATRQASYRAALRLGGEVALTKHLKPWLAFGDGWGIGVLIGGGAKLPVLWRSAELIRASPFLMVGPILRAPVGGPIWIEVALHYFPFETIRSFTGNLLRKPDGRGLRAQSLVLAFGLRFWF